MIETERIIQTRAVVKKRNARSWPARAFLAVFAEIPGADIVKYFDGPQEKRIAWDIYQAVKRGDKMHDQNITDALNIPPHRRYLRAFTSIGVSVESVPTEESIRAVFEATKSRQPNAIETAGVFTVASSRGMVTLHGAEVHAGIYTYDGQDITGVTTLDLSALAKLPADTADGLERFTESIPTSTRV